MKKSYQLGPLNTPKCPECGNSLQNDKVADYRFILCCASCKAHFIDHTYRPTNQETFDHVKKHLLTQRKKASAGIKCMYRTLDGWKCGIGSLIPDPLYHPRIEERYVSVVLNELDLMDQVVPIAGVIFLDELRRIHDLQPVDDWEYSLQLFAKRWNLDGQASDLQSSSGTRTEAEC